MGVLLLGQEKCKKCTQASSARLKRGALCMMQGIMTWHVKSSTNYRKPNLIWGSNLLVETMTFNGLKSDQSMIWPMRILIATQLKIGLITLERGEHSNMALNIAQNSTALTSRR